MLNRLQSKRVSLFLLLISASSSSVLAQDNELFRLGTKTNSGESLPLYPDRYLGFIANDFGFEDRVFPIGREEAETDFPYVLPGAG